MILDDTTFARKFTERSELAAGLSAMVMAGHLAEPIAELLASAAARLAAGGKLILCGNGGSHAICQHLETELMVRYARRESRVPLPCLVLPSSTTYLTALVNDFGADGFLQSMARGIAAFARTGDLVLAMSTSGASQNVLESEAAASRRGVTFAALTGPRPNPLAEVADIVVDIPTREVALIQEAHLMICHMLAEHLEDVLT